MQDALLELPGDLALAEVGVEAAEADGGAGPACRLEPFAPQGGVVAGFSFDDPPTLPYPFDAFALPDPTSPTGLRPALGTTNTVLVDSALEILEAEEFLAATINTLSGFSTWAPVQLVLSGPVELPAGEEGWGAALEPSWGSPVVLVEVKADGLCGSPLPVLVSTQSFELHGEAVVFLSVQPYAPLLPGRTYAVLVLRSLEGADGLAVEPHPHFSYLAGCGGEAPEWGDPDTLARAEEVLPAALSCLAQADPPLCPCDLAAATLFTTAAHDHTLSKIHEFIHALEAPPLNLSLDVDEGGEVTVWPAAELPGLPEDAGEFPSMSLAMHGAFDSPELRGPDKDVHLVEGAVVPTGTMRVPFVLMLPAEAQAQPFKLVVMGYGHSGFKERIGYLAERFGQAGLALASMDFIGHGELKGTGKFVTIDMAEAHGSFVQSQANLLRFFQAIPELAALDVFPLGAPDGVPDLELDGLGYIGESLGSLIGTVACAREPLVEAAVFNVVGGGFSAFANQYIGGVLDSASGPALVELKGLIQNFVDDFDPINAAIGLAEGATRRGLPRLLMMQGVVGDEAMDGPPTANLARALGLTYVCPCPVEVPFLPSVEAPAEANGLYLYDGPKHGWLLSQNSTPEECDGVRRQAALFLESALEDHLPLVVDPFMTDK